MSIKTELTIISPEMAKVMLATNDGNRSIRQNRVKRYAQDIKAGNWHLNGDTIRISKTGKLIDGQHRLAACVLAGIPIECLVVTGLCDSMFAHIDNGAVRSSADTLQTAGGYKNCNLLAATVRQVYAYEGKQMEAKLNNADVLYLLEDEFKEMPVIVDAVASKTGLTKNSMISAAAYIISRHNDNNKVIAFFERVRIGEMLARKSPEYALREWIIASKRRDTVSSHIHRRDTIKACLAAWNKHASGQDVSILRLPQKSIKVATCK